MKTCTGCKRLLPLEAFYTYKRAKDGRMSRCKECFKMYAVARRARDPEAAREYDRKATAKQRAKNREVMLERTRQWRAKNKEHLREYNRRYRAANLDRILAKHKEWLEANKDKESWVRYRREHGLLQFYKRRDLTMGGDAITLRKLAERDNWRCHICGKRVSEKRWSMDHLVPLSKGGPHTFANVALAHLKCNQRRGVDRLPAQLRLIG